MKDFPVFTTEYGVASLILREVPYQGIAYIRIQATQEPEKLLKACVSFCRMVGAERICATGHESLEDYPLYTAVWEMACLRESLGQTEAALWPVTEETSARFRELYNEKAKKSPTPPGWMGKKKNGCWPGEMGILSTGTVSFWVLAVWMGRSCCSWLPLLQAREPM